MKVESHHIAHKMETLAQLLTIRANLSPNDIIYRFYDQNLNQEEITYKQLHQKAIAIAILLEQSSNPGDRVLILSLPGISLISALFGCLYSGRIAIIAQPPTHQSLHDKLIQINKNSEPTVVISCSTYIEQLLQSDDFSHLTLINIANQDDLALVDTNRIIHLNELDVNLINEWNSLNVNAKDNAILQYSSGSTGSPKGVILTHENLLINCSLMSEGFHFERIENYVSWLPPYHDMGLIGAILSPLFGGFTSNLMSPSTFLRSPLKWLELIGMHQNVISGAPNFAYQFCIDKIKEDQIKLLNLEQWNTAYSGAEPIREETLQAFSHKFKAVGFRDSSFIPGYGLAEATLAVSMNDIQNVPRAIVVSKKDLKKNILNILPNESKDSTTLVNCGRLFQPLAIVDPNTLVELQENQIGEVWITGPGVAKGYWNADESTQSVFNAKLSGRQEIKYFRTGDTGFLYQGCLFITGRIKDLIIIHGENHYPHDIEYTIKKAIPSPDILNCAALSIPINGTDGLTLLCETNNNKDDAAYNLLVNKILEEITSHHNISVQSIVFVPKHSILLTTSGKIKRSQCRLKLESNEYNILYKFEINRKDPEVVPDIEQLTNITDDKVSQLIIQWIEKKYNLNPISISPNDPFVKFGLDSVNIISLVYYLEALFNINIPPSKFLEYPTPFKLANYLTESFNLRPHVLSETEHGYKQSDEESILIPSNKESQNLRDKEKNVETLKNDLVFKTLKQLRQDKLIGLTVNPVKNKPNYYVFNEIQHDPMLAFFSCSYMGFEWHPEVMRRVIKAEKTGGSQLSSSRAYVSMDNYNELTALLKQIFKTDPIIASTTTLGHFSTMPVIIEADDVIIMDEQVHNSVQMASKLCMVNGTQVHKIKHNDMDALEQKIKELLPMEKKRIWYLADGLYSMHGDFVPMPQLLKLMHRYPNLYSYIDDAHSFGWLGTCGQGFVAQYVDDPIFHKIVLVGSMAKAFAACGGIILTKNNDWRERIALCGGPQIFSGPIQPPIIGAAIGSANIMLSNNFNKLQQELISNIHYFKNLLKNSPLNCASSGEAPIFFIKIGDLKKVTSLCHYLHKKKYYVPPTGFPAVQHDHAGLRVTLNRLHKFSELDALFDTILEWTERD